MISVLLDFSRQCLASSCRRGFAFFAMGFGASAFGASAFGAS